MSHWTDTYRNPVMNMMQSWPLYQKTKNSTTYYLENIILKCGKRNLTIGYRIPTDVKVFHTWYAGKASIMLAWWQIHTIELDQVNKVILINKKIAIQII